MSKEDWGLGILSIIILGIVAYFAVGLADAAAKIVAALIGLSAVVIGAVIRYSTEVEKTRKEQMALVKQQNYQNLLKAIGKFAARQENGKNELTVAHIESWVFGDEKVVEKTNIFLRDPTQSKLKDLLVSMRSTLDLNELNLDDEGYKALFPPKYVSEPSQGFKNK